LRHFASWWHVFAPLLQCSFPPPIFLLWFSWRTFVFAQGCATYFLLTILNLICYSNN
jgi:hypothetical protein